MTHIGKPERATQDRVIQLFRDELGYAYQGNWEERAGNSNIEEGLLTQWLAKQGHSPEQIGQEKSVKSKQKAYIKLTD